MELNNQRSNLNENESSVNVGDRVNYYKHMISNALSNMFSSIKNVFENINKEGKKIGVNPQEYSQEDLQENQEQNSQENQKDNSSQMQYGGRRKSMMSVKSYTRRLKKNLKKQKNKTIRNK